MQCIIHTVQSCRTVAMIIWIYYFIIIIIIYHGCIWRQHAPSESRWDFPLAVLIDISQYRLLFGFFLLYTDHVPFELLDSAALLWRESCGGGGQIVFLNLTTIIYMVSTIHDVTGRRLNSTQSTLEISMAVLYCGSRVRIIYRNI
jgi:hypothetical protein